MFYYSKKYVKQRFILSPLTKVSAQTFARDCKKRIQLGKTLYTLILKTTNLTALINSLTGMEIFKIQKQPPEVCLKFKFKFQKFTVKQLCQGLFFNKEKKL